MNHDEVVTKAIHDILDEREKALSNLPEGFEDTNSKNDYVAYVTAYLGRASDKVFRNEREAQTFRENMVKAAGLCLSAIVAYDKGCMSDA